MAAQAETLAARYGGDVESLDGPDSVNAWRDLRELSSARPLPHLQLWRFSGPATNARELVEKMKEHDFMLSVTQMKHCIEDVRGFVEHVGNDENHGPHANGLGNFVEGRCEKSFPFWFERTD